ncbi:MAG: hypothetical protein HOP19_29550, partial [Acidobacteria bacterium]|nr:hypothetical protein [Acidobacteriota bacterium]
MVHENGPYEVEGRTEFSFDSGHPRGMLEESLGQNVWVISGTKSKGKTRYHLCALYHPEVVEDDPDGGFCILGKGKGFTPEIELTHLAWFTDLYTEPRIYSFGFRKISNEQLAQKLQEISTVTETEYYSPDEIVTTQGFIEPALKQITVNAYERNLKARKACIGHYGYLCSVCEFDFEAQYGEVGKEFIHVHHLTLRSATKEEYEIDPINDLRPVCPNCHSMIHKKNPP